MQFVDSALGLESLPDRVYALRFVLVLVASLCLPFLWLLCQRVFVSGQLAELCCLALTLTPGFMVYVSRVSNDSVAALFVSIGLWVFCMHPFSRRDADGPVLNALVTAMAMLSKAYGVLLVPVYGVATLAQSRFARGGREALWKLTLFGAVVLVLAGWWYGPVILETGTVSGEQFDIAASQRPLAERLMNLFHIRWWLVFLYGSNSHIWISGWSFLMLEEWMYWVFRAIGIVAVLGFVRAGVERLRNLPIRAALLRPAPFLVPAAMLVVFLGAIAYQGWQIFNARGDSTAQGWYLYGAVNAEVITLVAGLGFAFGRNRAAISAASLALLVAALDLLTVHFLSLPYYAGITSLERQGRTPILSFDRWPSGGVDLIAARLAANHPDWLSSGVLIAMWGLYLIATLALIAMVFRALKHSRLPKS